MSGVRERLLREKCDDLGFVDWKIELCVDYFIHRLPHKEVIQKYNLNIEYQSSLNLKHKLKKLIE